MVLEGETFDDAYAHAREIEAAEGLVATFDLWETRLDDLDRQIADLQALRHTVAHLHHSATTSDPTKCDTTTVCRYL